MSERVKIVVNPAHDQAFRSSAESLLRDGADTVQELEATLRGKYPSARVVIGVRDGFYQRWYVYRDGRWVRGANGSSGAEAALFT